MARSVRPDLPLGPTDLTLGCFVIFLAFGLSRITAKSGATLVILVCIAASFGGCSTKMAAVPVPEAASIRSERIWLAKVKNSTGLALLLPGTNPLRSLQEMAGTISSDCRRSVTDLLRDSLRTELEQKGYSVRLAEETDERFPPSPPMPAGRFVWAARENFQA